MSGMNRINIILAGIAAMFAFGCAVGPDFHKPDPGVPDQFGAATNAMAGQQGQPPAADLKRWWETFHDPILNSLIERAVVTNLDVRLAEARVREARGQLDYNRASLSPTVDANASYTRSRTSPNAYGIGSTAANTSSGTMSSSSSAAAAFPSTVNLYQAGFDAGWEVDVFGGKRRAIEAARDTFESQVDARRNAMITLLGDVAQAYISLRGNQYQLIVASNNAAAQLDTLNLQKDKFRAGLATDLDVANAEAQSASTESQLPTLQTQIKQNIYQLSILLDREPAALEAELEPVMPVPQGPSQIPAGLPSELLRRRPDVRAAERQLAAATANIGVATADLYPKLTLTGQLGLESLSLKTLADASSRFWSFGPTISWRIFDAGQILSNIRINDARAQEALISYRKAVLQSLQDVENTLVAYDREQVRRRALHQAVESSQRAVKLATQLNSTGLVDFLNVLTAQQTLYMSQSQLAISEQTVSTDLVAVYKALGGGWETEEQQASHAESQRANFREKP
jgi:multidrug efflux system outer membrane protein